MADIAQGNHANLFLNVGDAYRVTTGGVAKVKVLWGAPEGEATVTAAWQDFGPFGAPAKLRVDSITGTAAYRLLPLGAQDTVDLGEIEDMVDQKIEDAGGSGSL